MSNITSHSIPTPTGRKEPGGCSYGAAPPQPTSPQWREPPLVEGAHLRPGQAAPMQAHEAYPWLYHHHEQSPSSPVWCPDSAPQSPVWCPGSPVYEDAHGDSGSSSSSSSSSRDNGSNTSSDRGHTSAAANAATTTTTTTAAAAAAAEHEALRHLVGRLASQQEDTTEKLERVQDLLNEAILRQVLDMEGLTSAVRDLVAHTTPCRSIATANARFHQAAMQHVKDLRSLGLSDTRIKLEQNQILGQSRTLSEIDLFFNIDDKDCLPVFDGNSDRLPGWICHMDAILGADSAHWVLLTEFKFPFLLDGQPLWWWNYQLRPDQRTRLLGHWALLKCVMMDLWLTPR